QSFINNIQDNIDLKKVRTAFVEKDCWEVTEKDLLIKQFGKFPIYLYDGPHKRLDQKKALTHYIDYLEDDFVFLCDDWNWTIDVEYGTRDAFEELELVVHKEWVMKTPNNIDHDHAGWWNGYFAAVCSKKS
ncbi:MAG: hypothetical protein KAR20_20730, partial [Candidatus Heimdallarchaeota archaeon]|nr:hypothetical protein [Candidatus Heimdallarchaeota archaeon]